MIYDHCSRLRYLQPYSNCEFRAKSTYNNAMVTLAGEVVAHLYNTTYDALVPNSFDNILGSHLL